MKKVYDNSTGLQKKEFGKKLKKTRQKKIIDGKKMTQADLADEFEVNIETIRSWEQGRNYPPIERIIQLSDFLKVDLDYLLGDQDEPRKTYSHISEMTGLTYNAARCLANMVKENNDLLPIISMLIENSSLLYCIESAAFSEYANDYLKYKNMSVSAKTLYTAEKTAVFEELAKFIDNIRKTRGLDPL